MAKIFFHIVDHKRNPPVSKGGKKWMRCNKGTDGLMIGFKAALARTSREYFWAADWPDGGTAQNLQSELGVTDLLPVHCAPAGVGHSG